MASKSSTIDIEVADLRKVYLHAFDATVTDPATIDEEVDGVNTKYARQILKVLTDGNLLVMDQIEPGTDAWQPNLNMDTNDRKDAEAAFDEWANENGLQVKTEKASRPARADVGVHGCYCGCGEQVGGKSFYKPGHDARHAGMIGRLVASTGDTKHYNDLPSDALKTKAQGIAKRAIDKEDAKRKAASDKGEAKRQSASAKEQTKTNATKVQYPENGKVRVGKGTFEARRAKDGTVTYKSTDGEWKPASATATKSFKTA